jgi:hypothetical protein
VTVASASTPKPEPHQLANLPNLPNVSAKYQRNDPPPFFDSIGHFLKFGSLARFVQMRNSNVGSLAHVVHMPAAGDPGRTRTCDPLLRRQMLYPTELRGL